MKKMMALISALAVLMIAFSGCVGNGNNAVNGTEPGTPGANAISNGSAVDIGKLGNLSGFEYIGSFSLNETNIKENYNAENISGIVGGSEALYKQNKTEEKGKTPGFGVIGGIVGLVAVIYFVRRND